MNPFQESCESEDNKAPIIGPPIKNSAPVVYASSVGSHVAEEIVFAEAPKQSLMERLLSPQSLQWMMMTGGGLLVIGFVVWLWSVGIFANPLTAAVAMGGANLGGLGLGLWLYQKTRYKLAGRGLTLLASMLLPMHLWFYNAQGLIVLSTGGQLWIPALVCSVLYATIARITREPMFVYTLVGGVVLTGLLFLAGPTIAMFWSLIPTTTFLIAVALLCIAAERCFMPDEGDFSRNRFGKAFFLAGHITMFVGLALLLGGHVQAIVANITGLELGLLGVRFSGLELAEKLYSMGILVTAACAYFYSQLTCPGRRYFSRIAFGVMGWVVLLTLNIFAVQITFHGLLLVLSLILVAANVATRVASANENASVAQPNPSSSIGHGLTVAAVVGLAGTGLLELLFNSFLSESAFFVSWIHVAFLTVSGVACWTLPGVWSANRNSPTAKLGIVTGAFMFAVSLLAAANGFLPTELMNVVITGMGLPLVFAGAAFGISEEKHARHFRYASVAALTMVLATWVLFLANGQIVAPSLAGISIWALGAVLYFLIGIKTDDHAIQAMGIVAFITAAVNTFAFFEVESAYAIIGTVSGLGLLLLGLSVAAKQLLNDSKETGLPADSSASLFLSTCGNCLMLAGVVAAIFFVASQGFILALNSWHFGLLGFQFAMVAIGFFATKVSAWKQMYVVAAAALIATGAIALYSLSNFPVIHRIELGVLVAGATLAILGHIDWYNEDDNDDRVGVCLSVGSILMVTPMILGLLLFRLEVTDPANAFWLYFHEVGALLIGLVLLGSGIVCRLRSTTLAGGSLIAIYVASLILLLQLPSVLKNTSIMMMVGGAIFFGVAVLLSLCRDRILSLPERIREGKGVFEVLKWR